MTSKELCVILMQISLGRFYLHGCYPYASERRMWTGVMLLQSWHWRQGFLRRLVSTLFLENLCIACDTLRNMDFEQYTERDRHASSLISWNKLWWNSFSWLDYVTCPDLWAIGRNFANCCQLFRLCGEYARILLICDPFEGTRLRMSVTYSLGEEE